MNNSTTINDDKIRAAEIERLKAQRKALRKERKKDRKEQARKLKLKSSHMFSNEAVRVATDGSTGSSVVSHDKSKSDSSSNVPKSATLSKRAVTVSPHPDKSSHRGFDVKMKDTKKQPATSMPAISVPDSPHSDAKPVSFPINDECTSLSVSPSGRHIIAGFTDGTLRLFDTTGRLWGNDKKSQDSDSCSAESNPRNDFENLFDCDSSDSEGEKEIFTATKAKDKFVMSKAYQHFGAVACQIHAKGVITSLLMDVDCSEDGSFAFGGVLRGSTELVAVHLSPLERYHDQYTPGSAKPCILDLIKVYRYSDAKLKGFGACTRLKDTSRPEYRLFTGKGIKNMHIWSFIPPQGNRTEPIWQCLYDTPTNGNTITYLSFRTDSNGLLQGISKSDDQKLRVWDLSYEQKGEKYRQTQSVIKQLAEKAKQENYPGKERPKRPPYIDIFSTENALGVFGSYVFSGGDSMFNKMGVMFLDVEDVQSPFIHNELALPQTKDVDDIMPSGSLGRRSVRSGRQQRGGLKSVTHVAGLSSNGADVILVLSDGTMVHYNNPLTGPSQIKLLPIDPLEADTGTRKIFISRCEKKQVTILTKADFDSNSSRGMLSMSFVSSGEKVKCGFTESSGINTTPQAIRESALKAEHLIASVQRKHLKVNDKKTEKAVKIKNMKEAQQFTAKKNLPKKAVRNSKELTMKSINDQNTPLKEDHQTVYHDKTKETLQSVGVSPNVESLDVDCREKQSLVSPSTEAQTIGVAVSPEQPTPTTLKFQNESSKNNGTSIKKYFQQSKTEEVSRKRKNSSASKHVKSSRNKKVKFAGVPDAKIQKLKKAKTSKEDVTQTTQVSKTTEMDVASALCHLQSSSYSNDLLKTTYDIRQSEETLADGNSDFAFMYKSNNESELLNDMKLSASLRYRKSGTFAFCMKPLTNSNDSCSALFNERKQMIIHHRASHERLRNSLLNSLQFIIKNNDTARDAKLILDKTINEYEAMTGDLIRKQQMEASALAASHSTRSGNYKAPEVQVSFPFPGIFDFARETALKQITENLGSSS